MPPLIFHSPSSVLILHVAPFTFPVWSFSSKFQIGISVSDRSRSCSYSSMWFVRLHQICISHQIRIIIFKLVFLAIAAACLQDPRLRRFSPPWPGFVFALSWFRSWLHRRQILVHHWFHLAFLVGCRRSLIWSFSSDLFCLHPLFVFPVSFL